MVAVLVILLVVAALGFTGCEPAEGEGAGGGTTSTSDERGGKSGDVEGRIGEEVIVGNATITVRALETTFQPAMPEQRLSGQSPPAPDSGESFYQAYVRVKNTGVAPIRVDAEDFVCAVGESVVGIEPTRSGPLPRSLLKNASLDLILTFKAQAGFEPVLVYRPPWYDGTVVITAESERDTTTTTR
ncbi:MAG: DUF4352 domain-containing protein [Actinomycetia bacterium]|nr:DUF4352 domain-containing protein [Actinomycetes bacterium]